MACQFSSEQKRNARLKGLTLKSPEEAEDRLYRQRKGGKIRQARNQPDELRTSISRGKGEIRKDCLDCRVDPGDPLTPIIT